MNREIKSRKRMKNSSKNAFEKIKKWKNKKRMDSQKLRGWIGTKKERLK